MKKQIVTLAAAVVAALFANGSHCAPAGKAQAKAGNAAAVSAGKVKVCGVSIEPFDGCEFVKQEMLGKTVYIAACGTGGGFTANVNIIKDDVSQGFMTMEKYIEANKTQYKTLGCELKVVKSTESAATLETSMGAIKIYQRVLRDSGKKCFYVVTGTYGTEAEKGKIVRCVDSAEL